MKSLAKVPADRFQTAAQFNRALSGSTQPHTAAMPVHRIGGRRLWLVSAAALLLVALPIGWWGFAKNRAEAATLKSVALLPCEGVGPAAADVSLGDRWSEELIQKLVRVGALQPKSWLSVNRYKGTQLRLPQIAQELNAGTLVRCRASESARTVRLAVEVIRARDERVLFANEYEQPSGPDGISAVQSTAARDIADVLGVAIPTTARGSIDRSLTRDSLALRYYRLGRHLLEDRGPERHASARKSVEFFNRAVERDSNFAYAYLGLAGAVALSGGMDVRPAREYWPRSAQLIRKAISLDPMIAEAYVELAAYLLWYTYDWAGAEEAYRQALALNPSSVQVHDGYSHYLAFAERYKEAIAEAQRAVELDPVNPMARTSLINALYLAGNHDRAVREIREGIALQPEFKPFYWFYAWILIERGKPDSAAMLLARDTAFDPAAGYLHARSGRPDKARWLLDTLMALSATRPVDPGYFATIHAGLGNDDQALMWLERAYADRSGWVLDIVGPYHYLDHLRQHPRFRALRRQVGYKD